ncbi:hypothetical protein CHKEEEPN_4803 [Methylorubrum podarium]|nr:hypothetical protein CHKEEEPN_4803 [Methylorubrum podarium]
MVAERLIGAEQRQGLDRVGRVHVLRLHEPARLVGADRQGREPRRAEAGADLAKDRAVAEP